MNIITLADLEKLTESAIKKHIVEQYSASEEELKDVEILIAYESVGDYGCDSSSWFLFRKGGKLYENHGNHCSCYGFEDQWHPEETTVEYLKSNKFYFSCGGYDSNGGVNKRLVESYINENL
jgi:hypothetical protein